MPLDFIDHQLERLPQLVSLSGNAAMSVSVMTALLDLRPVPPPVEVPALETFSRPCQLRKVGSTGSRQAIISATSWCGCSRCYDTRATAAVDTDIGIDAMWHTRRSLP